jgi:hypothetical protein
MLAKEDQSVVSSEKVGESIFEKFPSVHHREVPANKNNESFEKMLKEFEMEK